MGDFDWPFISKEQYEEQLKINHSYLKSERLTGLAQ
jgi:hypothetical protein